MNKCWRYPRTRFKSVAEKEDWKYSEDILSVSPFARVFIQSLVEQERCSVNDDFQI